MVCPGCLRDVTGLVGPDDLLCPECVGIPTEELMPSLLESLAALDEEEAYLEHDEYGEACSLERHADDAWEAEAQFLLEKLDDLELIEDDYPPTFQGRPRF